MTTVKKGHIFTNAKEVYSMKTLMCWVDINVGCSFTFSFTSLVQGHVAVLKLSIRSHSRHDMVVLRASFACFEVAALNLLHGEGIAFSCIFSHSSHCLNGWLVTQKSRVSAVEMSRLWLERGVNQPLAMCHCHMAFSTIFSHFSPFLA